MNTPDSKKDEKKDARPNTLGEKKHGVKDADPKPSFGRKIDPNTVIGETQPAEKIRAPSPSEKKV